MSKEQKTLYKFEIQDGSKLRKFAILSPSRRLRQDGELYYTSQLSKFISAGVLPRALWEKLIKNNGGAVAEPDKKEYADLYQKLIDTNSTVEKLAGIPEAELTDEQKSQLSYAQGQLVLIRKDMQVLESEQMSLYENTAEAKARNQSIIWWSLNLAAEANAAGVYLPIVVGEDIDDKLDAYDDLSENDGFLNGVIRRVNYLVTIWYIGAANSSSDFERFDAEFKTREGEIVDGTVEEKVEEEAPKAEEPAA